MSSMTAVPAAALSMMAVMAFAVLMIVMMARLIRIILQGSAQICGNNIVRLAVYTGQKPHTSFLQGHPCTHANAATDQGLHVRCPQETC